MPASEVRLPAHPRSLSSAGGRAWTSIVCRFKNKGILAWALLAGGGGGLKGIWLAKETSPAPPPAKLGVWGVPRELLAPQLSCHERHRRVGVWVLTTLSSATQVCLSPSSDASNNLGLLGYTSTPIPSFPYPLTMIAMSRWLWWGRHYYYYHWTSEEIKAQRGLVTWSRPHSSSVEEPGLNRGLSDP